MAQNSAFSHSAFATGNSSSWADDDDETEPLPLVSSLAKVEEQEAPRAQSPHHEQQHDRRDRKYSNEYRERDAGHRERGTHEDRGRYGRGDREGYRSERREERAPRGGYENDRPKNPVPDQGPYKVYVGNLPFRFVEHDLVNFFGSPETIMDVRVQRQPETDLSKGFAYVEFRDRDALVEALKLDGQNVAGRPIRIDVATDNRKPRQSNSFFEKRGNGPRYEPRGDAPRSEAPRERPRLTLIPRSAANESKEESGATKKQSIFGEAKPRDESAFWERKKAKESEGEPKPKSESAKHRGPRERKTSHEEVDGRGGGRGGRGGRGRGERAEHTERTGGRGRGAAAQSERTPAKKEEPKPKAVEPKPKLVEPKAAKVTKIAAPPATKVKNVFAVLDDSDSD